MADLKISELTAETTLGDTDEMVVASSGATKKITGANLKKGMVPVADETGFNLDTTTYDNPITEDGKMSVLVAKASVNGGDNAVLAYAIEGDAFPRVIFESTGDGIYMGDGTFDPYNDGAGIAGITNGDGTSAAELFSANGALTVGQTDEVREAVAHVAMPLVVGSGAILLTTGDPNSNLGGEVGDLIVRTDAPAVNQYFYRCTTRGDASASVWAAVAFQPLDSDLTAIAALTTTSYGRALLALADAAAGRTALGLGTLATQSGTFSGTSSGTNTGDQTSVSGNAGTATALATARAIDGQSFDGTTAITVVAPGTHAATGKTTPVDADEVPLVDSAASNVLKKLTWANLKATLKTYFDTLYPSGSGTSSGTNTGDQTLSDATITTTDITTNNVSTSKHGFAPKAPNDATKYLDGAGAYTVPAGSGAPADATYITQTANGTLSAEQALGSLATGMVKNTTTTGVLSIGAEGTDYYKPGATDVAVADGGTGSSTAAGARTNLGVVIGTDVQAQDAELAALAGLTSAADKLPYFTGAGTATVTDFTTAGRALVDDADAAAQRTTLGLGTIATVSSTAGGDLTGTFPNPTLAAAGGGAAGPTGSATVTPIVTVDAKGRVTALSSATTAPTNAAGGSLAGNYPNPRVAPGKTQNFLPQSIVASCLAEAFPRWAINSNTGLLSSGRLSSVAVPVLNGTACTSVSFVTANTAVSAQTNWWFALTDSSFNVIRQATDQLSTAWGASTLMTLAMDSIPVTAGARVASTTVTLTIPTLSESLTSLVAVSDSIVVANANIAAYNGTFTVASVTSTQITYVSGGSATDSLVAPFPTVKLAAGKRVYTAAADALVYAVIMIKGTVGTLGCFAGVNANIVGVLTPILASSGNTGLTGTCPSPITTATTGNIFPWAAVS